MIALALGIVFLAEEPGAGTLVGLGLILLGSWPATAGPRPEADPAPQKSAVSE